MTSLKNIVSHRQEHFTLDCKIVLKLQVPLLFNQFHKGKLCLFVCFEKICLLREILISDFMEFCLHYSSCQEFLTKNSSSYKESYIVFLLIQNFTYLEYEFSLHTYQSRICWASAVLHLLTTSSLPSSALHTSQPLTVTVLHPALGKSCFLLPHIKASMEHY